MLDIPYLLSTHNVLNVPPTGKKPSGERSGLRGGSVCVVVFRTEIGCRRAALVAMFTARRKPSNGQGFESVDESV